MFYVLLALAFIIILFLYLQNKEKDKNNEAKLRFFTDLSHEFRSPITLILSPLEVLLKNEYDSNTTRSLQNMQRNGNRILSLLNQILDIRKIDNGQLLMEYTEVDMVHFLKQFFDIFLYESEKRKINLVFETALVTLDCCIDDNHFDKIVFNLI